MLAAPPAVTKKALLFFALRVHLYLWTSDLSLENVFWFAL
jgi:hypothetical protein